MLRSILDSTTGSIHAEEVSPGAAAIPLYLLLGWAPDQEEHTQAFSPNLTTEGSTSIKNMVSFCSSFIAASLRQSCPLERVFVSSNYRRLPGGPVV